MPRTKGRKNKPKTVILQRRLQKSSPQRKHSLLRLHPSPQMSPQFLEFLLDAYRSLKYMR
mgnify:CR=1 FL=1